MLDENGNLTNQDSTTSNPPESVGPAQQPQTSSPYNPFPTQPIQPVGNVPVTETTPQSVFNTSPLTPKKPGIPKVVFISVALVIAIAAGVAGYFIFQNMNKSGADKSGSASNSTSSAGWGNLSGTEVQKSIYREILATSYGENKAKEMANSWTLVDRMKGAPAPEKSKEGSLVEGSWQLDPPNEEVNKSIYLVKVRLGGVEYSVSYPASGLSFVDFNTVLAGDASWAYRDMNTKGEEDSSKATATKTLSEKIASITYPNASVDTRKTHPGLDGDDLMPSYYDYPFIPSGGISTHFQTDGIDTVVWYTK